MCPLHLMASNSILMQQNNSSCFKFLDIQFCLLISLRGDKIRAPMENSDFNNLKSPPKQG